MDSDEPISTVLKVHMLQQWNACWLRINVLTIISKLNRRTILYLFNMNISFSVLVSLA